MENNEITNYAVIKTGGRQYKVAPGDIVEVEKLPGEKGDAVVIQDILLLREGETVQVGTPLLNGFQVKGKILRQYRGPKLIIFKHRRRKNSRKKQGHRQHYTLLQIVGIEKQA